MDINKIHFAVNIRATGATTYTLQMIVCNYSLTKTLAGTAFLYPSKPDTILTSLCFAGRQALGVILLHNPYDEREEKNRGEDTGRWQKSANSYSPNNYPAAFSVLNKACRTLITPAVV